MKVLIRCIMALLFMTVVSCRVHRDVVKDRMIDTSYVAAKGHEQAVTKHQEGQNTQLQTVYDSTVEETFLIMEPDSTGTMRSRVYRYTAKYQANSNAVKNVQTIKEDTLNHANDLTYHARRMMATEEKTEKSKPPIGLMVTAAIISILWIIATRHSMNHEN